VIPPPHYQIFNQLVDIHEIQQGGHATEDDLDATLLAYFPKIKVGLLNQQSVCASLTNNF
jgi:hypothetical protein